MLVMGDLLLVKGKGIFPSTIASFLSEMENSRCVEK